MDTSDPDIVFYTKGCNHCKSADALPRPTEVEGWNHITKTVLKMKRQSKRYDCVLGLSGGVDSSWTAILAYCNNLHVLLTHFDNGFDDPRATRNIEKIASETGFDLVYQTMDFAEFNDIWKAHLLASVINIEQVSDNAITASTYNLAKKNNIKWILSGSNFATEAIVPKAWGYPNDDVKNIKDIHRKFGKLSMVTYPSLSYFEKVMMLRSGTMHLFSPLNYIDYNMKQAKESLAKMCGWEDYGYKHYESILTRFYQGYILPVKFGVDKRKSHFSSLICSQQMSREDALKELEKPPLDSNQVNQDKKFVLSKLGMDETEFQEIMEKPIKSHLDFKNDRMIRKIISFAKKVVR